MNLDLESGAPAHAVSRRARRAGHAIAGVTATKDSTDLLTGLHGATFTDAAADRCEPADLKNRPWEQIRADLDRMAAEWGPCDLGLPDSEPDIPDERIVVVPGYCREINDRCTRS